MIPPVEIHIEELVLHGFRPGDRHRISESIARELERLLAERGVPPSLAQSADIPHLDAGTVAADAGSPPEAVGYRVAATLYGGFGP
ncbi:MAG: hypothetical protein IT210_13315 [Armatimonadetes bacterium]|nr:hypothetical protein [Armatimonadota bacterium]